MGLRGLRDYANYLRMNDLTADRYEVAFWSRIARIFAVLLVVMLALPFALGPMRSSGQGARAVIGILIGAGFILLSNTLESSGQLLGLPPLVVGWLPSAILAMLTVVLLARAR